MAGLGNKKNQEDINILEFIRVNNGRSGENSRPLYIADCRGRVAATGNKLQGKGAENVSNYTDAHLCFCDILNIHTMRESQAALAKLLYPDSVVSDVSQTDPAVATSVLPIAAAGDQNYLRKLEDCGWLGHVALVLSASLWTAQKLHLQGSSVLVHCSDGWDRTAQVCGLAQLLLDPYYRTIEGFAILIEKEWLAFGHKFHERTGHAVDSNHKAQERSPIFVQWIECIAHVLKQFPSAFQFNEDLLIFVADHLHSCLFGNFLGDNDTWPI
jgi:myotubularin-related protein 1/2